MTAVLHILAVFLVDSYRLVNGHELYLRRRVAVPVVVCLDEEMPLKQEGKLLR